MIIAFVLITFTVLFIAKRKLFKCENNKMEKFQIESFYLLFEWRGYCEDFVNSFYNKSK